MSNLNLKSQNFFERVYGIVRKIPEGKVMTYGQVAEAIGTRDARKVGWALHSNKDGSGVPCHRVVNKHGCLAPGFAFGGPGEQRGRLAIEGVKFLDDLHVDLEKCFWEK